ncbi:hypothetical protein [Halobacillus sp. H74]|uniref:hypothetical protein n=1 Tax=Halobacillus sp. H74 TaxID=3457436 RepID=UPI003FCCCF4F
MKDDRTRTIISEIHYWKNNRLLPSEYCDFLLALYTKGDGEHVEERENSQASSPLFFYLSISLTLFVVPLSFLVIYFTEMGIIMQTGLLSSFVIITGFHFWWLRAKRSEWSFLPLIVTLLTMLLLSIHIVQYFWQNEVALYIVMGVHFSLWGFLGWTWNVRTLLISGLIGFLILFIYIVL